MNPRRRDPEWGGSRPQTRREFTINPCRDQVPGKSRWGLVLCRISCPGMRGARRKRQRHYTSGVVQQAASTFGPRDGRGRRALPDPEASRCRPEEYRSEPVQCDARIRLAVAVLSSAPWKVTAPRRLCRKKSTHWNHFCPPARHRARSRNGFDLRNAKLADRVPAVLLLYRHVTDVSSTAHCFQRCPCHRTYSTASLRGWCSRQRCECLDCL